MTTKKVMTTTAAKAPALVQPIVQNNTVSLGKTIVLSKDDLRTFLKILEVASAGVPDSDVNALVHRLKRDIQ